ncbi:MAG: mannitol dehydrogenase family protein [Pseudomonadota bacterium]
MNPTIARPTYDRSRLTPGIVHIGLGNFHRAHEAFYLHRLMQTGEAHDFAIVGGGVRPPDAAMRDALMAQDGLTTLIELDPAGISAEVTGAMVDFAPVTPDNAALIAAIADPRIKIVSLTVTEGGYYVDPSTGAFDAPHADILHDAANPMAPRTAFGAIIAALRARFAEGHGPVTVQSCDNLQGNGAIVRATVVGLARLIDEGLAAQIEDRVTFPNAMVDCIVPATGADEFALAQRFGINDRAPVTHENYRQWVIEDDFCAGRPAYEAVGVTFTGDVHPFETMKLRLLNAGHQFIANPGELLSCATIADCMADREVSGFLHTILAREVVPHVAAVPGMTPTAYVDLIAGRFENTAIKDTVRRVAFDGSSRHTGFVHPTLRERLGTGANVEGLALAEALWARMCFGTREDGSTIAPNDPHWDALNKAAIAARERPAAWLEQPGVYGDLAGAKPFAAAFSRWLTALYTLGTRDALSSYLAP